MQQYIVTGMSCAACSARVEKAVNNVPGVTACSVSLLTNSMGVEGNVSSDAIISAVENAGYGARVKGAEEASSSGSSDSFAGEKEALKDTETPILRRRLIWSIGFLAVLMYLSMGHMMWNWPVPSFLDGNHIAIGIIQMLLAAVIMVINQKFFISGFKAIIHRAPNMDTLVALGSGVSFVYSVYSLLAMTVNSIQGDEAAMASNMNNLYFESAAMILTLITVGKMLESYSKGRTTDALKALMDIIPETAVIERNGAEITVPVKDVRTGDIFIVRPGERIPVDGIVTEGYGAVDESALTGESLPVDKNEGSHVSAATINKNGFLKCRAERIGNDTTLAQIIRLVSDAAATKAPIAKIADKVSGIFVPSVIAISIITLIVWLIIGKTSGWAIARAVSVLVISCPCSLGLATPVAIMVGSGMGARSGILFKTAAALEAAGKINIVALDKTGTITKGNPVVTDICPDKSSGEDELILMAASIESKSEHPLSRAITSYADEHGITANDISDFKVLPGNGLEGTARFENGDIHIFGGNLEFINSRIPVSDDLKVRAAELASSGKTPLLFAADGRILGIIAVADTIRDESREAIGMLKNMGLKVVMITGDNKKTAEHIGALAGVDEVIANVLPQDKEAAIRKLQHHGRVAMVGDGINDAPALTRADMGIAIGAGSDIAIDAADIVLVNSNLNDVPAAIRLSRSVLRDIHQNLFWAFFYNCLGIPVAAGVLYGLGILLNPMIGAACMAMSSFCVVMNALRLNLLNIYDSSKDHRYKMKNNFKEKENPVMIKTMNIEGMMCGHCESTVKKALEAIDGVESAEVSHENGTAVVTCTNVSDETLKQAVEAKDYDVISIE